MQFWRKTNQNERVNIASSLFGLIVCGGPALIALIFGRGIGEPVIRTTFNLVRHLTPRGHQPYDSRNYSFIVGLVALLGLISLSYLVWVIRTIAKRLYYADGS